MTDKEKNIEELKEKINLEKRILKELTGMFNYLERATEKEEKEMVLSQINQLKNFLRKTNLEASNLLSGTYVAKPLEKSAPVKIEYKKIENIVGGKKTPDENKKRNREKLEGDLKPVGLEKSTLKRLREKEKIVIEKKEKKASGYVQFANKFFSETSRGLLDKGKFKVLERELVKANLPFTPHTYVSMIFFTTLISAFCALFIFLFFLFFNFGVQLPIITTSTESLLSRLPKVIWVLVVIPGLTFFLMYLYPSLEKKSTESKIDYELPFATINMSAISGSLIDPSKIFQIITTTKEYPYLSREFTKIINEINIQGYNFVNALRNAAFNSPSKKLSELFSGLATTINSGGDLPNFFEERSKSLLFEHRLEKEKESKAAETFMDIYISVVIAAPMILMLLLMMMRISGLGISLPIATITLIMVLGVTVINVVFLTFLHLRKSD